MSLSQFVHISLRVILILSGFLFFVEIFFRYLSNFLLFSLSLIRVVNYNVLF